MEKHEIAAILSDTRYFTQNKNGDRFYDIEWNYKNGFLGFLALPVAKFNSEEKVGYQLLEINQNRNCFGFQVSVISYRLSVVSDFFSGTIVSS